MRINISNTLQIWYAEHARELPWRKTDDAYRIWLSEIILQQTRVDQGLPYYLKFRAHYPTLQDLAQAEEHDVLKLWQGLGYYSRGRNLLKCAQVVENEHNGLFPADYHALRKLPGVGPYTAAAIASFAYRLPHAVLDGNVYRVLSRIYGIQTPINTPKAQKEFQHLADELLDKSRPDTHNQAIMEFGALHCTPKTPQCQTCPFQAVCVAFQQENVHELPVKQKAKPKRIRHFHYFIPAEPKALWLEKRTSKDIWLNLYQFPLVEAPTETVQDFNAFRQLFKTGSTEHFRKSYTTTHILSHQRILCTFWEVPASLAEFPEKSDIFEVGLDDIDAWPLPVVISKFIQQQTS